MYDYNSYWSLGLYWVQRSLGASTSINRTDHLVYAEYKDNGIYDY